MLSQFTLPRVETFFDGLMSDPWQDVGNVSKVTFDAGRSAIVVELAPDAGGIVRVLLIEVPHPRVARLRFEPRNQSASDYPDENIRSVVMKSMAELRNKLESPRVVLQPFSTEGVVTQDEAIVSDSKGQAQLRLTIERQPFRITIDRPDGSGGWFRVLEDDSPSIQFRPAIDYSDNQGQVTREYQIVKRYHNPPTARYMGFGEKAGGNLMKNGKQLTYVNFDNWGMSKWYGKGPLEDREPLYNSNTFFLEFNGTWPRQSVHGLQLNNTGPAYMDIAATLSGVIRIGTLYDDLDIFLYFGDNAKDVLGLYTEFIGRSKLKPRYVLGYHQACYGYETREDVERVAKKYRDYRIPIDGLHIDIDIQQRYRTFTVDGDGDDHGRFHSPDQMFENLRANGFKCSTNITPIISDEEGGYQVYQNGKDTGMFIRDERSTGGRNPTPPHADLYRGGVGYGDHRGTRGVYADLGRQEVREWWGKQYKRLFVLGLEMVWQDMTTPDMSDSDFADWQSFPLNLLITNDSLRIYDSDRKTPQVVRTPVALARNLYAYNLVKATYQGLDILPERRGLRNFIIARGGFTGMHRYAALWTGDNLSDWPYLRINILQSLAGGLSGQPISGADIGGFGARSRWEKWADPELLIRWTIAGAFLPWFRNHYTCKKDEQGDKDKEFQEPWAFAENRHRVPAADQWLYDTVVPACRHYIELRYRLIQLFYDAMFENTLTGLAIVRPLFVNDDHDPYLFYDKQGFNNDQWFVGQDLLVAPVIEKQGPGNPNGVRPVYLPRGSRWYCFMDNRWPLLPSNEGGQQFNYDAHLSADPDHLGFLCPIYVRAGAILPTVELEQYVGERMSNGKPANPITLNIYPGPPTGPGSTGEYNLYEDDGVSRASAVCPPGPNPKSTGTDPLAKNEYRHTRITHRFVTPGEREIRLERIHDGYTPALDHLFIGLLHDPGESFNGAGGSPLLRIRRNGTEISQLTNGSPEELADRLRASQQTAWYFNRNLNISFIKLVNPQSIEQFTVSYS